MPTPRRKVLGGSSAVNATVALRARASDFAKWGAHGAPGWSYEEVLPTFRHLENTPTGDDFYHGRNGPLPIRQRTDEELTPSLLGFIEASVATGFKRVYDFNAAEQNGAGGYPVTVVDGVRQSTALAYLTPRYANVGTCASTATSTSIACCSRAPLPWAWSPTMARPTGLMR